MQALALRARLVSDKVALAAGLDARLLAMLLVMAAIWLGLDALTGGTFLTPRNLFNLSLQVAVVGIMSCGMVLVIVSRHIDLSVGSQIGFIGVFGALLQNSILPIDASGDMVDRRPCDAGHGFADRPCSGPPHRLRRRSLVRDHAWQACSFFATPPSTSTAASPSLRSTRRFNSWAAAWTERSARFWSWVVCAVAIVAIVAFVWRGARRRAAHGMAGRSPAMHVLLIAIWSLCHHRFHRHHERLRAAADPRSRWAFRSRSSS